MKTVSGRFLRSRLHEEPESNPILFLMRFNPATFRQRRGGGPRGGTIHREVQSDNLLQTQAGFRLDAKPTLTDVDPLRSAQACPATPLCRRAVDDLRGERDPCCLPTFSVFFIRGGLHLPLLPGAIVYEITNDLSSKHSILHRMREPVVQTSPPKGGDWRFVGKGG